MLSRAQQNVASGAQNKNRTQDLILLCTRDGFASVAARPRGPEDGEEGVAEGRGGEGGGGGGGGMGVEELEEKEEEDGIGVGGGGAGEAHRNACFRAKEERAHRCSDPVSSSQAWSIISAKPPSAPQAFISACGQIGSSCSLAACHSCFPIAVPQPTSDPDPLASGVQMPQARTLPGNGS